MTDKEKLELLLQAMKIIQHKECLRNEKGQCDIDNCAAFVAGCIVIAIEKHSDQELRNFINYEQQRTFPNKKIP